MMKRILLTGLLVLLIGGALFAQYNNIYSGNYECPKSNLIIQVNSIVYVMVWKLQGEIVAEGKYQIFGNQLIFTSGEESVTFTIVSEQTLIDSDGDFWSRTGPLR